MRRLRSISRGRTIEAGSFSEFGEIVMRGAAAFALAVSASLLVLGPASAQQSTTGAAPPLVAPAPALVPGGAPALAETRPLLSGEVEASRCGRSQHRLAHLVAQRSVGHQVAG